MIVLFTDFSLSDPYLGQVKNVLLQHTHNIQIVDLLHNAPGFDIKSSAYLLDSYRKDFPANAVFLCVVDPGVGGPRKACAIKLKEQWFVGPENGLFNVLLTRNQGYQYYHLTNTSISASTTFHGRDIFAPAVAKLAMGLLPEMVQQDNTPDLAGIANDYAHVIYIDHFGNLISGVRYNNLDKNSNVYFNNIKLINAKTFCDVNAGEAFYYSNSSGLLEIAVNKGSAQHFFNANIGDDILIN